MAALKNERELTFDERRRLAGSSDQVLPADLRWITIRPSGLVLTEAALKRGDKQQARALLVPKLPLTSLESEAFLFPEAESDKPNTIDIAFFGIPELAAPLKRDQLPDLLKIRKIITPFQPEEYDNQARKGILSIAERIFGSIFNKKSGLFEGGEVQLSILNSLLERQTDKRLLVISAHGSATPLRLIGPRHYKSVEMVEQVVEAFTDQYAAIIDSSCNYEGGIPDFIPPVAPYFGVYGPTSRSEERQTMYIHGEDSTLYPAPIPHEPVYLFRRWVAITKHKLGKALQFPQ